MGQYQQWLHYRDIDRLLHTQLEELEEEFAQLQRREQRLQQMLQPLTADATPLLQSDNEILRTLAIGLNGHNGHAEPTTYTQGHMQGYVPSANGATEMTHNGTVGTALARPPLIDVEIALARPRPDPLTDTHASKGNEPLAVISSAPAAQNGLAEADEQDVTGPAALQPPQPLLHSDMTLPPTPGSHSSHSPHYEPMLLPEDMDAFIDGHSETEPRVELPAWLRNAALHNANGPIDQESMRTNRLIQRWIERWGHQRLQGRPPDAQEVRGKDISQ
jgi:hypothetical protein